jgi:NADPH:quinone reductase-like Zn-dependent oxidoreductase
VILLRDAVAKHPSILRLNPKRDPLKPCVYVGMTGLPVDHRFENHKYCYKSALTRISRMIDAGKLRVFVGAAFPLQEASQAYAHKPVRGKNVLAVDR